MAPPDAKKVVFDGQASFRCSSFLTLSSNSLRKSSPRSPRHPIGTKLALSRDLSAQEPSMFSRALLCIICRIIAR